MSFLEQDVNNLRNWADKVMPGDVWIPVNKRQIDAFMVLMKEQYRWPEFSLVFNKDMTKVMKIML